MKFPRASTVVASVFGIGYFDVAPGTIMSAVAVPLAILIALHGGGGMGLIGASIIVLVIGILACADHMRQTGRHDDPSECVIDELAGQWLACAFAVLTFGGRLPVTHISLPAFALAFVLFRLFDIWKPWPVSWADQKLSGGIGVMTDDIIAGLMAGVLVVAARAFLPI
jgi:phosphatidylglycerophosphatase A